VKTGALSGSLLLHSNSQKGPRSVEKASKQRHREQKASKKWPQRTKMVMTAELKVSKKVNFYR